MREKAVSHRPASIRLGFAMVVLMAEVLLITQ
jgi:hypothetical protein